jgi:mRNA interferase HigB
LVIISFRKIRDFTKKYPDAKTAIFYWYDIVHNAEWNNFNELKRDFNSADYVGNDRYVFNIKGNSYRMVAMIHFSIRTVYIRFIGTHHAYDNIVVEEV